MSLIGALSRARVALRIARRSSARSPGRSALIVALVALPVAGMAAVTLIIPSTQPTVAEKLAVELGHTQAMVQVVSNTSIEQDPFSTSWGTSEVPSGTDRNKRTIDQLFPAGTRVIPLLGTSVTVKTRTGVGVMNATEGKAWDPSLEGRYQLVSGHAPRSADQIVATAAALDRLGIHVGDQTEIVKPLSRTVTVVGILDSRSLASSGQEIFGLPGAFGTDTDIAENSQAHAYLPDTVLDWQQVKKLNAQGAVVISRDVIEHPPAAGSYEQFGGGDNTTFAFLMAAIIMAFALLEVTLLAGAAFMVGARAQERSLATVASVGSTRSTLLSIITANGLVLGAVGGVVGVGVGIGAGSLFMRLTDNGSATQYWGYHLWWPAMVGIAVAAVFVGWLGALVPAVRASKIDVVAALRGARRPAPLRRRRPIIGVILALGGVAISLVGGALLIVLNQSTFTAARAVFSLAITAMLIGGPIVIQVGLILCSGLVLRSLAHLLSRAGVAARLASRDAGRNPGRSVPALAVVMTTVFVAIFAMVMISSSEASARASYQYSAMPGQIRIPLSYWGGNERKLFRHPNEFAEAARTMPSVDTASVLKSVPDARRLGTEEALPAGMTTHTLLPALTIPPANQCPSDPRSVNFNKEAAVGGSDAYKKAAADWRCQDPFVLYGDSNSIMVGSADDLALVVGSRPSQAARNALARGGAVALHPQYVANGTVTISWWPADYWKDSNRLPKRPPATQSKNLAAVVQKTAHSFPYGIVISPATAAKLGVDYADTLVLAATKTPPTDAQLDALDEKLDTLIGVPGGIRAQVERGPAASSGAWAWGLLGLSGLIAIGAAAVAIGLARSDGRRDQATLSAVGASPGVRRGFGFWQALILTGTGSILGAAVGLVPALALTLPGSGTLFSAPWLQIVAAATLMPLAIAIAAWLLTRPQRLLPRRAAIT